MLGAEALADAIKPCVNGAEVVLHAVVRLTDKGIGVVDLDHATLVPGPDCLLAIAEPHLHVHHVVLLGLCLFVEIRA